MVTSSLVQFGGAESNIRRFPFIRTEEQVEAVLDQAPERACIIVFTFVSPELDARRWILDPPILTAAATSVPQH